MNQSTAKFTRRETYDQYENTYDVTMDGRHVGTVFRPWGSREWFAFKPHEKRSPSYPWTVRRALTRAAAAELLR